jgi:hypothetical protein
MKTPMHVLLNPTIRTRTCYFRHEYHPTRETRNIYFFFSRRTLVAISLNIRQYNAITYLQSTVAHALGFSVSTVRLLATDHTKLAIHITMKSSCYFVFNHSRTSEVKIFLDSLLRITTVS